MEAHRTVDHVTISKLADVLGAVAPRVDALAVGLAVGNLTDVGLPTTPDEVAEVGAAFVFVALGALASANLTRAFAEPLDKARPTGALRLG